MTIGELIKRLASHNPDLPAEVLVKGIDEEYMLARITGVSDSDPSAAATLYAEWSE